MLAALIAVNLCSWLGVLAVAFVIALRATRRTPAGLRYLNAFLGALGFSGLLLPATGAELLNPGLAIGALAALMVVGLMVYADRSPIIDERRSPGLTGLEESSHDR